MLAEHRQQVEVVADKSVTEVIEDSSWLRALQEQRRDERRRLRDILDGGPEGIAALLGKNFKGDTPPVNNLIYSGLNRLAQKIGRPPALKIDAHKDTQGARVAAERRERIVAGYDDGARLEMMLPQLGRWLPGYGYGVITLSDGFDADGNPFPLPTLRDPYVCYPSPWGVQQQPDRIAMVREMDTHKLAKMYPQDAPKLMGRQNFGGAATFSDKQGSWEGVNQGSIEVVEYSDINGTWTVVPDRDILLDFTPNPIAPMLPFVVPKRFAFNQLIGHYDHVIGLMIANAKLNLLSLIAMEDSVFSEALDLDTPVPTPEGWTTMGDIEAGDLVIGRDGLPTEVLEAKEVQTDRDCFEVTFEDGTSIIASDGHLWEAKVINHQRVAVRTTREMYEGMSEGFPNRYRVPASQPIKLPEADLPIDPYCLGAWLGDGASRQPCITSHEDDYDFMIEQFEGAGYETFPRVVSGDRAPQFYVSTADSGKSKHGTGMHAELRVNDLLQNKHIPTAYLRSSIDQRIDLVRGLMDTDGCASKRGHVSFSNNNERLIDGLMEVLRSLGEVPVASFHEDERSRTGGIWQVTWTARQFSPFRMERKAERVKFHRRGPEWVTITSIEPVETRPVRCIAVANDDHLFLAGDGMHVTHNTVVAGELTRGDTWVKGRNAVNYVQPGTNVQRLGSAVNPQMFQEIDRLERQLRTTAGYSVTDDGQSPNSFVTGRGLDNLQAGVDNEVAEYQTVLTHAIERLDTIRLAWDEKAYGNITKPLFGKGAPREYEPAKDIEGRYRTRRRYGVMAGWDDASKVVTGLQLLQAGIIDRRTMREEVRGIADVQEVERRIEHEQAERALSDALLAAAQQGDQKAVMALIEMLPASDTKTTLQKFYTPEGPQMTEEEQMMAEGPVEPSQPENTGTILSRLLSSGESQGGAQIVGSI